MFTLSWRRCELWPPPRPRPREKPVTGRKDDERDREREGQRNVSALTIREIALVEDCFEDSAIREIRLARALDETAVFRLATIGDLEYHPEFPRPFFRVRIPGGSYLKGVVGAESFRVFFPRPPDAAELRALGEAVEAALALPVPNSDR